jgi:hypothetical protein
VQCLGAKHLGSPSHLHVCCAAGPRVGVLWVQARPLTLLRCAGHRWQHGPETPVSCGWVSHSMGGGRGGRDAFRGGQVVGVERGAPPVGVTVAVAQVKLVLSSLETQL